MDLFKLPLLFKKRLRDSEPLIDVNLSLYLSFYTSGQVKYMDINSRPRIVEFKGSSWSVNLLLKKDMNPEFSAFIINPKKIENQIITLTIKINANFINNKTFEISAVNFYDGWFKID